MNIVLLNTFPVWGGDEKWTINLGKGLKERGHFVVISSHPGSATEKKALEAGIMIFPFRIGPDIAFWKVRPFQKFLRNNKINVVLGVQNRDVKIGCLAARLAGITAIFARQGLAMVKRKLDHRIAFTRYVDGIITNTNSIKKLYDGYGWFPKDFVRVVYDGVDIPDNLHKINLHQKLNLVPNSKIVMGAGRLVKQKRFDLLIDAARLAREDGQPWSFVVAGEGELKQALERKVIELGISDIVRFIGFQENMFSIMNSSDLFVLSSDSEGMSNALREAMGLGLPCVATDVFGVSELFQNGKYGIKVARGDSLAMYNALKNVLSDPELMNAIGKGAMEHIRSNFTMQGMINRVECIFEDQLRRKKR